MISEFDLIRARFTLTPGRRDVTLAVGDDCAILESGPGALVTDSRTFSLPAEPEPLLDPAVFIARGITVLWLRARQRFLEPAWMTLNLCLPDPEAPWIREAAETLARYLAHYAIDLVGGDTTRGLSVSLCFSLLSQAGADRTTSEHSRLQAGDLVYCLNHPGMNNLALLHLQNELTLPEPDRSEVLTSFRTPQIDPAHINALLEPARCLVPLEHGLTVDLENVLAESALGADLQVAPVMKSRLTEKYRDRVVGEQLAFTSADLDSPVFIFDERQQADFETRSASLSLDTRWIGSLAKDPGIRLHQ